jgi:NAD(P)-dependent dehydrogenase (short-subunit alcohol dehydrogenase family)
MALSDKWLLTDQVAIVTGGGAGVGRAIALTFAEAGAHIVIADIDPDRGAEVEAKVRALGRDALFVPTDCSNTDQIRAMVEAARTTFGRIDILVNNAGGVSYREFRTQSEGSWRRHIDLNLVSMLAATSSVIPVMVDGGRGGSIINVTSIEASRAAPGYAVYSACKAGMNNFTRTIALEVADDKIRVNCIAPDFTKTPGMMGLMRGAQDQADLTLSPQRADGSRRRIPLGRPGIDMECGQAALFLASDMASYITGIVLPVDGGTFASSGWFRDRHSNKWALIDMDPPSA